jgi:hypothetical protein
MLDELSKAIIVLANGKEIGRVLSSGCRVSSRAPRLRKRAVGIRGQGSKLINPRRLGRCEMKAHAGLPIFLAA